MNPGSLKCGISAREEDRRDRSTEACSGSRAPSLRPAGFGPGRACRASGHARLCRSARRTRLRHPFRNRSPGRPGRRRRVRPFDVRPFDVRPFGGGALGGGTNGFRPLPPGGPPRNFGAAVVRVRRSLRRTADRAHVLHACPFGHFPERAHARDHTARGPATDHDGNASGQRLLLPSGDAHAERAVHQPDVKGIRAALRRHPCPPLRAPFAAQRPTPAQSGFPQRTDSS